MFAVVITAKGIMMMKFRYYQSIPSLKFFFQFSSKKKPQPFCFHDSFSFLTPTPFSSGNYLMIW